jgi:hypothetical protein
VVAIYRQKFFTLKTCPYNATFDVWIGTIEHYGILA